MPQASGFALRGLLSLLLPLLEGVADVGTGGGGTSGVRIFSFGSTNLWNAALVGRERTDSALSPLGEEELSSADTDNEVPPSSLGGEPV